MELYTLINFVKYLTERVEALEELAAEHVAEHEAAALHEAIAEQNRVYTEKAKKSGVLGGEVIHATDFEPLGSGGCVIRGYVAKEQPAPEVGKKKATITPRTETKTTEFYDLTFVNDKGKLITQSYDSKGQLRKTISVLNLDVEGWEIA